MSYLWEIWFKAKLEISAFDELVMAVELIVLIVVGSFIYLVITEWAKKRNQE